MNQIKIGETVAAEATYGIVMIMIERIEDDRGVGYQCDIHGTKINDKVWMVYEFDGKILGQYYQSKFKKSEEEYHPCEDCGTGIPTIYPRCHDCSLIKRAKLGHSHS